MRSIVHRFNASALALCIVWITGCSSDVGQGPNRLSKSDELHEAHGGPTASQIFGNADKWAGHYVKLDCKITNVIPDSSEANAMCGKGVALDPMALSKTPNIDYSDPNAVNQALAQQERAGEQFARDAQDQALIVLTGDRVSGFDGGQHVTIVGPVIGSVEGKNGMGATMNYATVRVDYAE